MRLTNRWSQPLAAVKSTFEFMKEFSVFVRLAPASRSLLWLFVIASALASPPPSGSVKQDTEFKSHTEETTVRVYRDPSDFLGPMEFRVFGKGISDPDGFLLWKGGNRASALLSFDGESIAINQHAMSDLGLLFVFTRRDDGSYQKVDVDFQKEALKLFEEQLGFKEEPSFDHIYCYAETWLSAHQLLGVLSGHESGQHVLDGFWFIFDCSTKQFSFDLCEINKAGFHKVKKENED